MQTLNEAINFTQDLKLGHYMKVPPRATFLGESYPLSPGKILTEYVIRSAIYSNNHCSIRSGWGQGVDVQQYPKYMQCEPEELVHVSA